MALSRSENMARIRGTDTAPELTVRRELHRVGLRYRLQIRTPGGKADLAIVSRKFALFIDGCFWHGCPEHYVHPRSNSPFWDRKLRENVDRDRRQTHALATEGWRFVRVWEHEVRENPLAVVKRIQEALLDEKPKLVGGWRVVLVKPEAEGPGEERSYEDLLDPTKRMTAVRDRSTAKTGRVAKGRPRHMSDPVARMAPGGSHARKSGRDAEV